MRDVIQLFRRTTTSKGFIPEIDGLRFIAIATVVVFHFHFLLIKELGDSLPIPTASDHLTDAGWWLSRLDLGVKVFFGISGFILSVPFWKAYRWGGKPVDLKSYFIRRLTRLEPPFLVAITGFLLVHWLILNENLSSLFPHFLATILYVHTLIYNEYSTILPVTWSLETEVQFYLIIPFLAYLALNGSRMRSISVGILLFLGSIAFRGYLLRVGVYGMMASLPAFLSHFLVGIAFAYVYLSKEEWLREKHFLWDGFALLSMICLFWFYKPQSDFFGQIAFNVSLFFVFVSGFKSMVFSYFLTRPWVYLVGGMCYTLYLVHLPLFGLMMRFSDRMIVGGSYGLTFLLQFSVGVGLLLLIGGFFFLFVEKPCMEKDWPQRLVRKIGLVRSK
jgi:peptidoglycan/LPS O-acetylase OafA/YrhL